MRRWVRVGLQVAVSGGLIAVLLWQVDLGRVADEVRSADGRYLAAALAIFLGTTWLMAWRWQLLLRSKGIEEPLGWLVRAYFVGFAASQVLPTSLGGDAVRIVEHARRRSNARAEAAGAILIERVVGAAGTLVLVAVALAVAAGRYEDVALLVWGEIVGVAAIAALVVLMFSRRTRTFLQARVFPLGRRMRLQRPLESVHTALHGYRDRKGVLLITLAITVFVQLARTGAIWCCGEAVGLDLSGFVYLILGPLLFFVVLMPFTINGLGVREAFFVAFLGRFGVDAETAFAVGFLYYVITVATALPGAFFLIGRGAETASGVAKAESTPPPHRCGAPRPTTRFRA